MQSEGIGYTAPFTFGSRFAILDFQCIEFDPYLTNSKYQICDIRSTDMAFQHKALDLTKAQIRLHQLDPSSSTSAINAEVTHFDFDETCPEYEAISYTWGENIDGSTIQLSGQQTTVGDNLYRLLDILRTGHQGWLWIDQICTDQKNSNEPNHQVRMMHQTYTRASKAIAWLGAADSTSDLGMQSIANTINEDD
ncbi:hypothetical protein N0V90_007039 [Kalmusia sp. IMI 367209]|nr:hypothetical protein N0V90_007039 [Kalmusia sp. IMI 367209]